PTISLGWFNWPASSSCSAQFPDDLYFLLGVLNSKPLWEYCKRTFTVIGDPENGGRLRFFSQDVLNIPIPVVPPKQRREVEELVHKCLTADDGTRSAVEKEIDTLVARLYGLDGTSKP
ncbi:hypothetical protein, partial [Deinococcus sp. GbtcB9]|uniref:hypothetical protein n=1 Tax=Deinococcus sp. GbtcB9 TaxID=2824754 RepID=UPI001C302073